MVPARVTISLLFFRSVLRVADLGRLRAKVMPRKVRRYDTAAGNLITSWRTLTIVSTCIAIASLATLATVVSIKR